MDMLDAIIKSPTTSNYVKQQDHKQTDTPEETKRYTAINSELDHENRSDNIDNSKTTSTTNRFSMSHMKIIDIEQFANEKLKNDKLEQVNNILKENNIDAVKLQSIVLSILSSRDYTICVRLLEYIIRAVKINTENTDKLDKLFSLSDILIGYLNKHNIVYKEKVFEFLSYFPSSFHSRTLDILKNLADPDQHLGIQDKFFMPLMCTPLDPFFDLLVDIAKENKDNNKKISCMLVSVRKNIKELLLTKMEKNLINSKEYYAKLAENLALIIPVLDDEKDKKKLIKKFLADSNINVMFRAHFYLFIKDKNLGDKIDMFICNIIKLCQIPAKYIRFANEINTQKKIVELKVCQMIP